MTATELVEKFLADIGHPQFHELVDGPFWVNGVGLVTEPKLTALTWKHFRVAPRRSVIRDAWATLAALSREPEPEMPVVVEEPKPETRKAKTRRTRSRG